MVFSAERRSCHVILDSFTLRFTVKASDGPHHASSILNLVVTEFFFTVSIEPSHLSIQFLTFRVAESIVGNFAW